MAQMSTAQWAQHIYNNPSQAPVFKQAERFWKWTTEPTGKALQRAAGTTFKHARDVGSAISGMTYARKGIQHTWRPVTTPAQAGRGILTRAIGQTEAKGWWAKHMPKTLRAGSAAGVAAAALLGPGLIIGFGSMSPHGAAIGIAEETAGIMAGAITTPTLMALGKVGGRRVGHAVAGGVAGRLPFLRHIPGFVFGAAQTGFTVGAIAGSVVGFGLGFAAWEAARWSVGFALHTLPTFARQFQSDLEREGFGGDYTDSAGAATMRARSLQVMGKSFSNARSALGQEASLLHV